MSDIHAALAQLAEKVWHHVSRHDLQGRTVTLKVRFPDFQQLTRARTLPRPVTGGAEMLAQALELAATVLPDPRGVRLLGITLSGFDQDEVPDDGQLDLFGDDLPQPDLPA